MLDSRDRNESLRSRAGCRALLGAAGLAVAVLLLPGAGVARAQTDPGIASRGLQFFDARAAGEAEVKISLTPQQRAARSAAMAKLRETSPGATLTEDPYFATPRFLRNTERFLSGPRAAGGAALTREASLTQGRDAVRAFLTDHRALFEIDVAELDQSRIEREAVSTHTNVSHFTYQQQIAGIDLFGAELRANVTARGELITVGSTMLPRPASEFAVSKPVITPLEAIKAAAAHCGVRILEEPAAKTGPEGVDLRQQWTVPTSLRSDEAVVTKLVYFPFSRDGDSLDIRTAWSVVIPTHGVGHTYDVLVDSRDGALLYRHNRLVWESSQPVTMRVYTSDSPAPGSPGNATPIAFQFPTVSRQLVTKNPAEVIAFSPNGWINDGGTETTGNNVDAYLDRDATPNSPDLPRPNGGASRVFDFAVDLGQEPVAGSNQAAAVVQGFYLANLYHDKLYALGFTEQFRNFQTDNFGRGGTANDAVRMEMQDGSGTNNANFSTTGTDGSTSRCQMYLWTSPTPDRDGGFDNDIIIHELTHGTSIRLHGGLSGTQAQGMGEGWSDFYALSLNAQPGDDPNAVYPMGAYATYLLAGTLDANYYFGIRRFPYSTDLNKNPITFADIDPGQISFPPAVPRSTVIGNTATSVHNIGELWCGSLWECRALLWNTYGFAANDLMLQLVTDGMKLSGASPDFIVSRDSIIAADLALTGGVNRGALWSGFAKRGLGFSAAGTGGQSTAGVVEAFDLPQRVVFSFPSGQPVEVAPNVPWTLTVNLVPEDLVITPGTARVFYSINNAPFASVALNRISGDTYTASIPGGNCLDQTRYYISVDTSIGNRTNPASAPATFHTTDSITPNAVVYSDRFETDLGWTTGVIGAVTTGQWVRVDPNGTAYQPEDDHTADPAANCFVTGQGAVGAAVGAADIDGGSVVLTSPAIDLTGATDAVFSYWRWLGTNSTGASGDNLIVEVSSNNGSSWTTVENVTPANTTLSTWVQSGFRASTVPGLALTSTMRLRFTAGDIGAGTVAEAAIDDIRIVRTPCGPSCIADVDNGSGSGTPDGGVGIEDLLYYLGIYNTGAVAADVDNGSGSGVPDGGVGIEDLLYYLQRYDAGC